MMTFPQMLTIRQNFERPVISDPATHLAEKIDNLKDALASRIAPGQSVAIACPSRGIASYPLIIKTLVQKLKEMGLRPFLFPAMGSHGGATAQGQKRTLEHLGITESYIKAPIRSSLETVQIGTTAQGVPVMMDRLAYEADHVVPFNRIKKHTDFEGDIESGLMKICVIGMGKFEGAEIYHRAMMTYGPSTIIKAGGRVVLEKTNILFAVGSVENGYHETAALEALLPSQVESEEKRLLAWSKAISPGLPFDEADILLIDRAGKEIAGSGVDYKVVGRIGAPLFTPEPKRPSIRRIMVSDLTEASGGNACGLGIFDLITSRLHNKVDRKATDLNIITSCLLEMGGLPCIAENDQEGIAILMRCIGMKKPHEIRIMRIRDTLSLDTIQVSENFSKELEKRPDLTLVKKPEPMRFKDGYLVPFI
ncbi:MAG: nickel-dependent lactate racemase [Desulfobacterales bacterium]|nr:nickel-dependent lactate racemase [Desulfobacterales bacterium]